MLQNLHDHGGSAGPYGDLTPWGDVCKMCTDGCLAGLHPVAAGTNDGLRMYPTNRGDQLYLSVDAIEDGVHTVSVDIYDLFGKRVSARTIAVQASSSRTSGNGFINTVLELHEMAAGMYMVNITAGGQTYTERLVIQP